MDSCQAALDYWRSELLQLTIRGKLGSIFSLKYVSLETWGDPLLLPMVPQQKSISCFTDILGQSVTQLPSHTCICETTEFINTLRRIPWLLLGCLLVTLNVSSYRYFTWLTFSSWFSWYCQRTHLFLTKWIIYRSKALPYGKRYMYGPSYANLFICKAWMRVPADPGQNISSLVEVYWRHFAIHVWDHGESFLWVFSENLKCHQPTIKFAALWLAKKSYLPRYKGVPEGWSDTVGTDLHVKPTIHTSTSKWMVAIHIVAKPLFLTAKHFASDESVWTSSEVDPRA